MPSVTALSLDTPHLFQRPLDVEDVFGTRDVRRWLLHRVRVPSGALGAIDRDIFRPYLGELARVLTGMGFAARPSNAKHAPVCYTLTNRRPLNIPEEMECELPCPPVVGLDRVLQAIEGAITSEEFKAPKALLLGLRAEVGVSRWDPLIRGYKAISAVYFDASRGLK